MDGIIYQIAALVIGFMLIAYVFGYWVARRDDKHHSEIVELANRNQARAQENASLIKEVNERIDVWSVSQKNVVGRLNMFEESRVNVISAIEKLQQESADTESSFKSMHDGQLALERKLQLGIDLLKQRLKDFEPEPTAPLEIVMVQKPWRQKAEPKLIKKVQRQIKELSV